MGRQVEFRTCPQDLEMIEAMLRELGATFLAYYHHGSGLTHIETIDPRGLKEPLVYATLPSQLLRVKLWFVEAQGYSVIRGLDSPVIELSRAASETEPTPGRLYYHTGTYVERLWVPHDPEFLHFAEAAARWIRRRFSKVPGAYNEYEGPAARTWRLAHANDAHNPG
jgi:hypothetical protein